MKIYSTCTQWLLFFFGVSLLSSCISYESLVNFEQEGPIKYGKLNPIMNQRTITIQPNDVIDIKVHTQNIETAVPFNLLPDANNGFINDPSLLQLNGYLVDPNGYIDFPVIGRWEVQGLSIDQAKQQLLEKLDEYLVEPVVNIRFLNFRVTIAGEVNNQGIYTIYSERISIPELIAMAGGLTPYAMRDSILIVREEEEGREYGNVNMSSNKFFESEYYFLKQNDYLYIKPSEAKRGAVNDNSNKILPFVSAAVSIAALLITAFK